MAPSSSIVGPTIVIDCRTDDLDSASEFWAEALGRPSTRFRDPENANYRRLDGPPSEVQILVQAVDHASRVHIDIETDDLAAEVARLEKLGARRVAQVKRWWVMEAPTGPRFRVVQVQRYGFEAHANVWGDQTTERTGQR